MKARKILVSIAALALVAALSIGGTIAYLTSTDKVENTFTVGNVKITLTEAPVDKDGKKTTGDRVRANSYKLLPNGTYDKDPTVFVQPGSEEAYVRMKVKVETIEALKAAFPKTDKEGNAIAANDKYYTTDANDNEVFLLQELVDWDPATSKWESKGYDATTSTYEFWYKDVVSNSGTTETALEALFTQVKIPESIDNDHLAKLNNVKIIITAEAMQKSGFDTAAEAWAKFPTT